VVSPAEDKIRRSDLLSTKSEGTPERTRKTITKEHRTLVWQTTRRKREEVTSDEWVATRGAQRIEGNSLVLLQVNCRSILNKSFDFWNLVDIYNPDVILGMESWLKEEISNAEVFRHDYTTFRRDRNTRGVGVLMCVKDCIACAELWVDEDFEMIAVELKAGTLNFHGKS
jgi:hypothetical protein